MDNNTSREYIKQRIDVLNQCSWDLVVSAERLSSNPQHFYNFFNKRGITYREARRIYVKEGEEALIERLLNPFENAEKTEEKTQEVVLAPAVPGDMLESIYFGIYFARGLVPDEALRMAKRTELQYREVKGRQNG